MRDEITGSPSDACVRSSDSQRLLCWAQGIYFALTGLWPILHIRSFEVVTGAKTDDWLVKTVGALIVVVAATLISAAYRRRIGQEMAIIGGGSALALGLVDLIYVAAHVIPPIYLLDAAVEGGIVIWWGLSLWKR